ncbi:MAG: hypothetical protein ACYC1Z_15125 [Georgenia sp.]
MKYGDILILGIVFSPLYIMLLGWFLGRPRNLRLALVGVGYLTGITVAMWGGLALFAFALKIVFF